MWRLAAAGRAVRPVSDVQRCTRSHTATGYLQATVVVLPSRLAEHFAAFCRRNPACLPLLFRSQPGDASCPPLARHTDIRTAVSQYCVYEGGRLVNTVSSLQGYITQPSSRAESEHQWSDMVCFYLGSSSGPSDGLYRTAVPCAGAGGFRGPLVVTMRPIPAARLDAADVTGLNPLAPEAPVHIGDAAALGIQDLSRPDYGEQVELQPGDVTAFWASGATAIEAILSSQPSLAFSHSPGCMFPTRIPDSSAFKETAPMAAEASPYTRPDPQLTPLSFLVSHNPLLYSLASRRAVARIRELELIIGEDPGQRGIKALFLQDELLRSCLALSHASSVAITTGLPTHYMHSPPDETDGPPGAVAMATMLLTLGKQVTIVTDRRALEMYQAIIDEAVKTGVLTAAVPLITFEGSGPDSALDFLCHHGDASKPRFDHLVAIERSGRAEDGNYYNMRGVNIKHLVDPIDDLFIAAKNIRGIITTGIGDGGNELGMGKVKEKVKGLMPSGGLIACDVPADYAITAGVSNWGGYAVACGLYLLHTCPSHRRYLHKGMEVDSSAPGEQLTANLPSVDKEESFLSTLVRFGIRSGKTRRLAMEVDGLPFHPTHSGIISRLLEVTLGSSSGRS